MPDDYYVYVLFRPWNGQPFYVGKGRQRRFGWHKKAVAAQRTDRTGKIIRKAVALGAEIPAVKVRENLSEFQAHAVEVALIAALGRGSDGCLSNQTDGGEGASGSTHSPEARQKIRASQMGNTWSRGLKRSPETIAKLKEIHSQRSAETIAKMRAGNLGKVIPPDQREKMRLAKVGTKQSPEHIANKAASHRGKKRSAEARARMSAGQKGNKNALGRIISEETRAKMAASARARWGNPEERQKLLSSMSWVRSDQIKQGTQGPRALAGCSPHPQIPGVA